MVTPNSTQMVKVQLLTLVMTPLLIKANNQRSKVLMLSDLTSTLEAETNLLMVTETTSMLKVLIHSDQTSTKETETK